MKSQELSKLLDRVRTGQLSVESAVEQLTATDRPKTAATGDARVDIDRERRCGFPEVVFGEGKTSQAIVDIFEAQIRHGQSCFATRINPEQAAEITKRFPAARCNPIGRTITIPGKQDVQEAGYVAVITAGTGDRPVAEEALDTLRWMRCRVELIFDVGVAGPHRLHEQRDRLAGADAVVVVAGMEGALPSVVGGSVDCPVIAVPTRVGYGASFGGIAALLGMLTCCASNVTVVNIDGGFKGGYVAGLIARRAAGALNSS